MAPEVSHKTQLNSYLHRSDLHISGSASCADQITNDVDDEDQCKQCKETEYNCNSEVAAIVRRVVRLITCKPQYTTCNII